MNAGHDAVLAARSKLEEPEWASALPPCTGNRECPVRLELLDVAEALRAELLQVLLTHRPPDTSPPGQP